MKVAIMQPYVLPYIGYFQLIKLVDHFVFYDDVNFIKKGWINRNRILINNQPSYFTIPCCKISQNSLIGNIKIEERNFRSKLLKTISMAYKKAPYFNEAFTVLEDIMQANTSAISDFAVNSVTKICNFLEIKKNFHLSSSLVYQRDGNAEDKIISICRLLKTTEYINMINGRDLYSEDRFSKENIKLSFLQGKITPYKQFNNEFIPALSIIDVMMFNDKKTILEMLKIE